MTNTSKISPVVTQEITQALAAGKPVVALESTIIAHGMPYPENFTMAKEVEQIVRHAGAVPATIAVVNGAPRIGLSEAELQAFAQDGPSIVKLSVRDLPFVIAGGLTGATTVAATMRLAAMAGLSVFATGGIGGAHLGAENTFDISADLAEFAESNVAVVTAGAKAILDLGLTLEVLESLSVPVIGFNTVEFPAFYSRSSGFPLTLHYDKPQQFAAFMKTKWALGLKGGIVVANPIPYEAEIPAEQIIPDIKRAIAEAEKQQITGKHLTPFLLAKLSQATSGRSLTANIALVKNNAKLAAEIAKAYSA